MPGNRAMKGGDFDIMKKLITLTASILFILAFAGLTFAAEQTAAPAGQQEAAPAKTKKPIITIKDITGKVTAIDRIANTLTVQGKDGDMVFTTKKTTRVINEKNKKKKNLDEVKTGDEVIVRYKTVKDKNVAVRINIMQHAAQ